MTELERFRTLAEVDPKAADQALRALKSKLWLPHEGGQKQVLQSQARFRILRAGRRWGKTQLAAHAIIMEAIKNPGSMNWWVSQSDKTIRRGYRAVLKQLPRQLLAAPPPSEGANDRILRFANGSQIEFYTAGTPDSLAGEGVDFCVVDEAALIEERVWFQLLRPTLSDTNGRALIISTPRGRNWFWRLAMRGERGGEYESFHFTSAESPYTNKADLDDARETLPHVIYAQEYLAEFVQNAASMFAIEDENVVEGLVPPEGHVVLGIDLAKKQDWTVISGANAATRQPCYLERLQETSWPVQEELIAELYWDLLKQPQVEGVTVVIDSTGLGDVVFDHLDDKGIDVIPVNFGAGLQKERMVRLLAADIEHGRAFITPEEREEFEHYEYEISTNGRYKFEASIGHDDYVSAKMLQNWGIVHEAPPDVNVWDPPEDINEALNQVVREIKPDSPAELMRRPEVWSGFRG